MSIIKELKQQFLEYIEIERNRSLLTIKNYDFYLERFIEFAKSKNITKPSNINQNLVTDFRLWLNRMNSKSNEPLSKNTQNYHLIALRSFLKFLAKRDVKTLAPEKIELAKMPQRSVDFLEIDEVERLLESPLKTDYKPIIKLRDKSILETLFSTGLRVSELANLKIEDINLKRREFPIKGKGGKIRIIFLSNHAIHWIKKYLEQRKDLNPFLFVPHDKANKKRIKKEETVKGLTSRSIQRIIEKYRKIAGITKHVTPHTLRHSYATDLLMNGADIRSVQAMLGHASITTTQIYTHITNQKLRDVHKSFHSKKRNE